MEHGEFRRSILVRIPNSVNATFRFVARPLKMIVPSADGRVVFVRLDEVEIQSKRLGWMNRVRKPREARRTGLVPIRIYGCDVKGEKISEVACTLNISPGGTRLVGLSRRLKIGDIVWLQHRQEKGRFQIVWTRKSRRRGQWEAGLRCLEPESRFWLMELCPGIEPESFRQLLKTALGELASADRLRPRPGCKRSPRGD